MVKKLLPAGMIALAALWCSIAPAKEGEVYKVWPEAEKVAQKTWRPVVAAFVKQGDTQFMGSSSSVMGDRRLRKALKYLVLIQIDLVEKGDGKLRPVDEKNNGLMSKLMGQATKTMPILAVAGPDLKLVKIWEQAAPDAVRRELPQILVNAIKQYRPLDDKSRKQAENLIAQAGKEEEEGNVSAALETLGKVLNLKISRKMRINKECGVAKQAQEMIESLKSREEGAGTPDPDEEEPEEKEEKKERKQKPKPPKVTAVLKTDFGKIEIELFTGKAPGTCEYFTRLVKSGIYNGSTFGYVMRGKLIQCVPDPAKKLPEEGEPDFIKVKHEKGIVAFAHGSSRRKAGAPFYIAVKKLPERDGRYAVFGKVKSGLAAVTAIASSKTISNKPTNPVTVHKVQIKE